MNFNLHFVEFFTTVVLYYLHDIIYYIIYIKVLTLKGQKKYYQNLVSF